MLSALLTLLLPFTPTPHVSFQQDIVPLLTRPACNSGGLSRNAARQERLSPQPARL